MVFTISPIQLTYIPKGTVVLSQMPNQKGNIFIYKLFLSDSEIYWKIENNFEIQEGETIRDCYNFMLFEK